MRRSRARNHALWWASCLGVGLSPAAPGTAGSLVGAGLFLLAALVISPGGEMELAAFCLGCVALFSAVTLGDGHRVCRQYEDSDPSVIVSDELAGIFVVYGGLSFLLPNVWPVVSAVVGFAAFRLFDIAKPLGIRRLERIGGAVGVLLDDLAAGLYALVVSFILIGVASQLTGMA